MSGRPEPKVLLMRLSQRASAKGTRYLSGYLGKAELVAFLDQEPDKLGNPQWNVYASEPRRVIAPRQPDGTAGEARLDRPRPLAGARRPLAAPGSGQGPPAPGASTPPPPALLRSTTPPPRGRAAPRPPGGG